MIYALKLTITNFCGYKCKYCYVNTFSKEKLNLDLGKKYIKYYLSQKGDEKIIFFLGGEALLEFDLLESLILYSKKISLKLDKKLTLFLTTSGLSLNENKLLFLFNNKVKIGISIDGDNKNHGINRVDKSGKNTFKNTLNYIKLFNKLYDDTNLGYALTVDENTVKNLFYSFLYLSNLDKIHRNITIAGVYKNGWKDKNLNILKNEILKICNFIYLNIEKNKFYYYNILSFFILGLIKQKKYNNGNIEIHVFPNGEVSLMLFKQSILENIDNDPTNFRFDFVSKIAEKIFLRSKTHIFYKKYIDSLFNKAIL